jgi:hypothetical protein
MEKPAQDHHQNESLNNCDHEQWLSAPTASGTAHFSLEADGHGAILCFAQDFGHPDPRVIYGIWAFRISDL